MVGMLAKVDLFSGLPNDVLHELAAAGSSHTFAPGRAIVTQGATDSGFQLIVEGEAAVLVHDVAVRTMHAGDYFGEISLIDGGPRSATVVAGADGCRNVLLSPLAFWKVIDKHPGATRPLFTALTQRIRSLEAAARAKADG